MKIEQLNRGNEIQEELIKLHQTLSAYTDLKIRGIKNLSISPLVSQDVADALNSYRNSMIKITFNESGDPHQIARIKSLVPWCNIPGALPAIIDLLIKILMDRIQQLEEEFEKL